MHLSLSLLFSNALPLALLSFNYNLIADEAGTEFNVKIGLLVGQCSCKTVQFNFMLYSPKRRAVWSCL